MRQRIEAARVERRHLARRHRRRCSAVLGVALAVVAVAGCGGGSTSASNASTTPPSTSTAPATTTPAPSPTPTQASNPATTEIKRAFVTFFDGRTSADEKIRLVQNGQQFAPVIRAQATSPLAKSTTATVATVTVTSPTTATLVYTILLGGRPALPNQAGQAVRVNGAWKVAAASFCQLLALEGQKVPGCPAAG